MAQPASRPIGTLRVALTLAVAVLLGAPLGVVADTSAATGADAAGADAAPLGSSPEYRQAEAHAGDVIQFEAGDAVRVPFVPAAGSKVEVDGAAPRSLPMSLATGRQMRDAPVSLTWATGPPEDAAEPWHFTGLPGGSESTSGWAATGVTPRAFELASATLTPPADVASGIDGARVGDSGLRREVFGFLPYWELADRSTVLDWRTLSTVAYFSVGCTSSGALLKRGPDGSVTTGWAGWTSSRMTAVIDAAHAHAARVVLTVSCFAWSADGAAAQAALLGSASARARLARQVAAAVRDRGADGVNLDFEPIVAGYGDEFTKLVRSVRSELRAIARGYQLTFDAMGNVDNQPIAAATEPGGADAVLVMGYDYRRENAENAGSIAPLRGPAYDLADTVRAFTAQVSPSKIILGVPWYGRAWSTPNDAPHARSISGTKYGHVAEPTYSQAYDLLRAFGRHWDAVEASPWTAYRKKTCTPRYGCLTTWRELYVDDAASLKLKYDLVNRAGLRGVGIWALGFDGDHPELRAGLAAKFLGDRTAPVAGIVTLAPRQRDEGFRVAWTASDQSPIRGYDVQVSIDGGRWTSWLTRTTLSSSIYVGANGHGYAFRVRATDAHGNRSAWGSMPLASLGTPSSIGAGGFAVVVSDWLRLRAGPSTGAGVRAILDGGDALRVIAGPRHADGYTWYQVTGPILQWATVSPAQVGWVAARGNGFTNVVARSPVYATRVDAGISGLRLNAGGRRVLTPNGDGVADRLRLTWTNNRDLDSLVIRVYRSDGRFVGTRTLPVGKLRLGPHRFDWDGVVDGAPLAAGTYVIQLQGAVGPTTFSAPSSSPVSPAQVDRWGVVVRTGSP